MGTRENDLKAFMGIIDYEFKDIGLLNNALTHSSYMNEKRAETKINNERMEFLGDAILDAVISEYLYLRLYNSEEGVLTRVRASIVCETSLAECSFRLRVGEIMLLGKGEVNTGGRKRTSILADAMEAILGSLYLDGGMEAAKHVILNIFSDTIEKAVLGKLSSDYKTKLQELIQSTKDNQTITYKTVREEGPDHNKIFYVQVLIDDEVYGEGKGKNKKEAERNAAKEALEKIEK